MAASAEELTGTISNIDLTRNTFQLEGVEGKEFRCPNDLCTGLGPPTDQLEIGERVTIGVTDIETDKQPINVMRLEKVQ
jgi:hypothetical protein